MGTTSTTVTANWTVVQDAAGAATVVSGDDVEVFVNNSTPPFTGEAWSDIDLMSEVPAGATITDLTFSLTAQVDGSRALSGIAVAPRVDVIDKSEYLSGTFLTGYGTFGAAGVGNLPDDNDPHDVAYENAAYAAASGGGGIADIAALAAALSDASTPVILRVTGPQNTTSGSGLWYRAPITLTFHWESNDLPCDTTVEMDLSTAQFMGSSNGGPFGEFGDGVIFGGGGGGFGYPDFFFDTFTLDPAKRYRVTVTFDPSSSHDSGGRRFWLSTAPAGSEESVETLPGFPVGNLYDAGPSGQFRDGSNENTADSVTVTIGPGINGWDDGTYGVAAGYDRLWFETDTDGAVSAVSVRKLCTSFAPPLRLTNRDDMFASAPRVTGSTSRQGSLRLTGYL